MSGQDNLFEHAKTVLAENDCGEFTRPAPELYPHQWLWDSCFIAIGLRHLDTNRAQKEILSLFRGQWANGLLPHMVFTSSNKPMTHQDVWQSWLNPLSPDDVTTSGITQPPLLAEAIVRIGEKLPLTERRTWYHQVWPNLLKYHEWLYTERDPHGEGLVLVVHPWETGLDSTPPWMQELSQRLPWWIKLLHKTHLDSLVSLLRTDTRHVPAEQRMLNVEVLALGHSMLRLRRQSYDINKILNYGLLTVEDLNFNAILIRANTHLKEIAKTLRQELPEELVERMTLTEQALEELWDPYTEQYYSRDFETHKLLKEPSIATLLPLYGGSISQDHAAKLVTKLENDHVFGTPFPVPSVPLDSSWFNPERYWQGPSWVNINWLIIDGLKRYGFDDHAAALRDSTLEMVSHTGFFEYFHPLTGAGLGAVNFSWTAALVIDLLKDK